MVPPCTFLLITYQRLAHLITFVQTPSAKEKLGSSLAFFVDALSLPGKSGDEALASISGYIDIRDVAALHALSLTEEQAGGKRIVASSSGEWRAA